MANFSHLQALPSQSIKLNIERLMAITTMNMNSSKSIRDFLSLQPRRSLKSYQLDFLFLFSRIIVIKRCRRRSKYLKKLAVNFLYFNPTLNKDKLFMFESRGRQSKSLELYPRRNETRQINIFPQKLDTAAGERVKKRRKDIKPRDEVVSRVHVALNIFERRAESVERNMMNGKKIIN